MIDEIASEELYDRIQMKSFLDLVGEMQTAETGLLIARVQTRDRSNYRKIYFHHFYAPSLIKTLFRSMLLGAEQVLRSRYHPEFPLTPKNPLTNEVIVAEVGFYLVSQ